MLDNRKRDQRRKHTENSYPRVNDINDRQQFPILKTRTTATRARMGNGAYQRTNTQGQRHVNADDNTLPNGYSFAEVTRKNETSARTTTNRQNNGQENLTDFITLTNEIRELNRTFDIAKMLRAVREFKRQLHNCNSAGEQFQLLLEFCQKLDD